MKKHPTIASCGLDCGLCPRFYTKGTSKCGGCGGLNFQGNPSCGILNCCANQKRLEVCAECADYPCSRINILKIGCDSFVTHKKILPNIEDIRANGLEQFLEKQKIRINILEELLAHHDDGRTKGFYCISCALLPIDKLQEVQKFAQDKIDSIELKERCRYIRGLLTEIADSINVVLKLDK